MTDLQQLVADGAPVVCRADVYRHGDLVAQLGTDPAGTDGVLLDGKVDYDSSRTVLRSCNLTVGGPVPAGPEDLYAPTGLLVQLWRGARDFTGEVLLEPVGRYAFDSADVTRIGKTTSMQGFDESRLVSDAAFESPWEIDPGTSPEDAIEAVLLDRYPTLDAGDFNFASTGDELPYVALGVEAQNDPWAECVEIARASGMRLFFDTRGRPTMIDVPDPNEGDPDRRYTAGETLWFLDAGKQLDARPANIILADGEPDTDDPPVHVEIVDDDATSASYVGRYRRPFRLVSPFITTEAQAERAARGELRRRVGLTEQFTVEVVPDPELDVWTVFAVEDDRLGVDARYVVDRVSCPLRPGRGSVEGRRRLV